MRAVRSDRGVDSLLSGKLDFWKVVALAVSVFLVDGHVVVVTAGTTITVLSVDSDVVLVTSVDGGGEGRVLGFLVFPSARKIGFSFYSDASRFLGGVVGVVGVRRREDREGDRDSGVKVQIAWGRRISSRMPSEML